MSVELNRRSLITGLISLVAAPAIVRVANIMPVKVMEPYIQSGFTIAEASSGFSLDHAQHAAFYARLKTYMDAMVADGMWDKLDVVHLYDAPSERLARTNWKSNWPVTEEEFMTVTRPDYAALRRD